MSVVSIGNVELRTSFMYSKENTETKTEKKHSSISNNKR